MAERIRIGINYNYNRNWMGGTYYVQNLVRSLDLLDDSQKPHLVIIVRSKQHLKSIQEIEYPYTSNITYNKIKKGFNQLARTFLGRNIMHASMFRSLKAIFPLYDQRFMGNAKNSLYWIPDFQEKHLPEYFSNEEIKLRNSKQLSIANNGKNVVFSSNDAASDFGKFFPDNSTTTHVLNFAVFHPHLEDIDHEAIRVSFQLPEKYFIVTNQFWAHKNHMVVLKAMEFLKKNNLNIHIAFTGKEYDPRNPDYFKTIQQFVKNTHIESNVSFLGFIDRKIQLSLMKHSMAIIQPSYFEGWSTVIEDGKALNNLVVASSLSIHKEQINKNVVFFNPDDHEELAQIIADISHSSPDLVNIDYRNNQRTFGEQFLKIVESINS